MFKRYLRTLLALLLLLCLYLMSLLPLWAVSGGVAFEDMLIAFCVWTVIAALSFIPALAMLIRNIWFFEATAAPTPAEQLIETLLTVNATKGPVQGVRKGNRLIISWRYSDHRWCEMLSRQGIRRLYELHLTLDHATRTVRMVDRIRSIDILYCPDRVTTGWRHIPLPLLRVDTRTRSGVERFHTVEPQEVTFQDGEIKSPVLASILASGWNARFSLL